MRRPAYYDPLDHDEGICESCGDRCRPIPIDIGIGPYEFWGDRGTDVDIRLLSPCCEANVIEPITEEDDE